jgi:hypothetical protein
MTDHPNTMNPPGKPPGGDIFTSKGERYGYDPHIKPDDEDKAARAGPAMPAELPRPAPGKARSCRTCDHRRLSSGS